MNKYSKTTLDEKPTLFYEFHGSSDASVSEATEGAKAIAEEFGGGSFLWETTTEERNRLWHARHSAWYEYPYCYAGS